MSTVATMRRSQGYSVVEMMIVVGIIAVMFGVAIFSYTKAERATKPDAAGLQVVDFLREANELALMSAIPHRVELTPSTTTTLGTLKLIRTSDSTVLRQSTLDPYGEIIFARPTAFLTKPAAPFDFSDVAYTAGKWSILFHADGSATDTGATPTPLSGVIYLYQPKPADASAADGPTAIRAISLFGPTGSARLWGYDGTNFIRR